MIAAPVIKPTRTTGSKPRTQPPPPQPFDPDELTRKLYIVLAEQKAYAERRRWTRAQAEKRASITTLAVGTKDGEGSNKSSSRNSKSISSTAALTSKFAPKEPSRHHARLSGEQPQQTASTGSSGAAGGYRHIPQVAASQFARTTKAEPPSEKTLMHRLSRPAMKFHMDGPNGSREMSEMDPRTAPCEQSKTLKRVQSEREKQYDRNQFQHTSTLQATIEVDERNGNAPARVNVVDKGADEDVSRRFSTMTISGWDLTRQWSDGVERGTSMEKQELAENYELAATAGDHRVDWTQSDEAVPRRATATPAPRRQESRWSLKARIGSFNRHGKDDRHFEASGVGTIMEESPKSSKGGFFARFKR